MTARVPAPFPYVGGKSRIAARVWQELGNPYSFLDPFMGSNAMLLARPDAAGPRREIVGDLNWRNAGMKSTARRDELVLFSPHCVNPNPPLL